MIIDTLKDAPAPFTGTEIQTLPNGFKLILKEDHTAPVVSIQAWARCGAVNESPDIYGISHGLEHMVFKGTPTRSAGDITRAIESQGGVINAATQLETTHYYLEVPSYGSDKALDVLVDTILNPTFPQEELERERLVILEEIHRRDDSPEATLWDEFITNVFKGTPYSIKVIGNEKTVSSLSREDLNTYYRANYTSENQTFVVVGDFDKKSVLNKLRNSFEPLKKEKAPAAPPVQLQNWSAEKSVIQRPVQMTYIAAGLPTVGLGDKDLVALDLLSDILGGGSSSRLNQKMREDKQTVLSISCDMIPFRQKGLFAFFMDTLPQKADNALDQLFKEVKDLPKNPIKDEELKRAKTRTKSDWLMGSETPRGQASTLGSMSVLGHSEMISQFLPRVETLTANDLMDVAKKHLIGQRFAVTKVVPQK